MAANVLRFRIQFRLRFRNDADIWIGSPKLLVVENESIYMLYLCIDIHFGKYIKRTAIAQIWVVPNDLILRHTFINSKKRFGRGKLHIRLRGKEKIVGIAEFFQRRSRERNRLLPIHAQMAIQFWDNIRVLQNKVVMRAVEHSHVTFLIPELISIC